MSFHRRVVATVNRRLDDLLYESHWTSARISDLRCQEAPFSALQGFSGKQIDSFPPCQFFTMYLSDADLGFNAFCAWYREWFIVREGWRVPKHKGGMANGSLALSAIELYRDQYGRSPEGIEAIDEKFVEEAIRLRVQHYVGVLDSIRVHGFDSDRTPPILCSLRGGLYHLRNGHHRVSALRVLGQESVKIAVANYPRFAAHRRFAFKEPESSRDKLDI